MLDYFIKYKKLYIILVTLFSATLIFLILFFTIPRLTYELKDDDTYYVSGAYGNAKEYTIKSKYKNKKVMVIGEYAFEGHTSLRKINFEENSSINRISRLAFANCNKLEKIIIPKSVTKIYQNAFLNCVSLKTVIFEEDSTLKNLGGSAFFNCKSLSEIAFPETLENIGTNCFFNNNALKKITLPKGLKDVYSEAFYGCDGLTIVNKTVDCRFDSKWLNGTTNTTVTEGVAYDNTKELN